MNDLGHSRFNIDAPLVSIIINNFNYGRFLSEAIDSALGQTYPNTEVIVVDDGSTDKSSEIISKYGTRIIPVLKENGGQASALNAGFERSHGDLISFLDSDDLWHSNKIEQVINILSSSKHREFAYLRHNLSKLVDGVPRAQTVPGIQDKILTENISPLDLLFRRRNAPTSAICAPRCALSKIMPIPEAEFRISADAFLYTHLPAYGPVISVNDILGLYRVHGENAYYFEKPTQETIVKTLDLELALLGTLPKYARYSDGILSLSHSIKKNNPQYIKRLGPMPKRLFRIWGPCGSRGLRSDILKTICKELLRSIG